MIVDRQTRHCLSVVFDECFTAECTSDTILQKRLIFDAVMQKMTYFLDCCVSDAKQAM